MKHLLLLLLMIPVMVFGQSQKNPFVFFDEPGEVTNFKEFKVFQSLWEGYALAHALSDASLEMYLGPVVLLHQKDKYFYDEEIVRTPEKSVERQVGVYRYETKQGRQKTVPIIQFEGIQVNNRSSSSSNRIIYNKKQTKSVKVNSSIADEVKAINDYLWEHPDEENRIKFLLDSIIEQLK
jgi:hypothetical protein